MVKCHSKRSVSRGEAVKSGEGVVASSEASLRMRFMVGVLEVDMVDVGSNGSGEVAGCCWGQGSILGECHVSCLCSAENCLFLHVKDCQEESCLVHWRELQLRVRAYRYPNSPIRKYTNPSM